jgi:hypothetical protein
MKALRSSPTRWGAAALLGAMAVGAVAATAPMPVIYPAKGQSPAQTDQDKLACFQWGKAQSGFDPMQPPAQPQAPVQTAAAPSTSSGSTVNGSMIKGAAGGAAVAELTKGDAGKGAAIGVLGAAVRDGMAQQQKKQQQQQQAQQQQQQARQQQAAAQQQFAQQRATFERAFGACLEGRGYVVK